MWKNFLFTATLALALSAPAAAGAETRFKTSPAHPGARGKVELKLSGSVDCDRLMRLTIFGLDPESTYGVWLITRSGERVPAGRAGGNFFTSNSDGAGGYTWFTAVRNLYWNTLLVSRQNGDGTPGEVILSTRITP